MGILKLVEVSENFREQVLDIKMNLIIIMKFYMVQQA